MTVDDRVKWLSVVGIGEDGLAGVSPVGRAAIAAAAVLVGGARHLAMVPLAASAAGGERWVWSSPIAGSVDAIVGQRGRPVCVLASGDPLCYGIGATLLRRVPVDEMTIVPSPSAFSLACSRLGWPLAAIDCLSLCGRDPALLHAMIYPGARLLVLSADRQTPAIVAQRLRAAGFGPSPMTAFERLGGPAERAIAATAADWTATDLDDLNTIAIHCLPDAAGPVATASRVPGLPDDAYHHDGQLTKREVRAATLAALAPTPGQLLWDVGAGCGSIAIEWMRSDRRCRAIAIERNPRRRQYAIDNAIALGVPDLDLVAGTAPEALAGLPAPDAIFIGGGLTAPDAIESCWRFLKPGGRLVANAVTIEGEQRLFEGVQRWGGQLVRLAIQRAEPVGQFLGWKSLAPVTQWSVVRTA